MKYKEIAELTPEDRVAREKEWTQALFNLRLSRAREHGRLENPMKLRQLRRDIARLRTAETADKSAPSPAAKSPEKTAGKSAGKKKS